MITGASPLGRLKLPLFLSLFIIIAGLVAFYAYEKAITGKKIMKKVHIDSSASLVLSSMHQTSSRNGIKEWTLDAASAKLLKNENLAVMETISVVFFMDNGKTVYLTSDQGTLNTETHDMTFSGNVVVSHADYRLLTDKLHYEKKRHIMYSTTRIQLKDAESIIEADSFETDLNRRITVFKGNVKGQLSEKFDFFNAFNAPSS
ncbi:MAG: LPS export ABC transporter periplasmic protein LptC [Pseudomonadota bacterium]